MKHYLIKLKATIRYSMEVEASNEEQAVSTALNIINEQRNPEEFEDTRSNYVFVGGKEVKDEDDGE